MGLLLLWVQYLLYSIAICLSKLSALAFYARVFSIDNKGFRTILWVVTGIVCAWVVVPIVSIPLECRPIQAVWDYSVKGECVDVPRWWLANAVSSFVLDIIILVLPVPLLWRLQIKLARKILICGLFLCGYV